MNVPQNPGPPLTAGDEYCACAPPTAAEYAKAAGIAFLIAIGGVAACLGLALLTARLWSVTSVVVGVCAGLAIYRAAGRHRSVGLGIMAACTTILTAVTGYALLWLPVFNRTAVNRELTWYHIAIVAAASIMAYGFTGGKEKR